MSASPNIRYGWMAVAFLATLVPGSSWAAPTQPGETVNPIQAPTACEFCHSFSNPFEQMEEPSFAPLKSWQGGMMANSARDPVFWAGLAVADADMPGETELCVRCHAPRAFLDGDGGVTSIDELEAVQQSGIECELCHRMVDEGVIGNAEYTIDDVLVNSQVPRRGQFDFTDGNPIPPHEWIDDPFISSSTLCGTCHDVTTPLERVDDAGVGMGINFNEQRTYTEWFNSDYADGGADPKSCQSCHMPEVEDAAWCTENQNQFSHATGGRRHDLVGANRFMVELIKQEYGSAGANLIANSYYDYTIERMDEFLPSSASLELTAPSEVDLTAGIDDLGVLVTNKSGHKLPSGYSEGRIMWLEVVASYGGELIYSSGAWDQVEGIEQDAQLHTYEAVGEEFSSGTTFHLLRNNHWTIDSRIPPKGLIADVETDPVGDRYTLQMDGTWPNFDSQSYSFDGAPEIFDVTPDQNDDDELELTVRLRYLINTPEYIEFLGDNGGNAGIDVAALFEDAGGAPPVTLAQETILIPITAFGSVGPTDETGEETETTETTTAETDTTDETDETDVSTSTQEEGELGTDGPPSSESGDGGCGCSSDASGGGSSWMLFFLGAGMARRRRRRLVRKREAWAGDV